MPNLNILMLILVLKTMKIIKLLYIAIIYTRASSILLEKVINRSPIIITKDLTYSPDQPNKSRTIIHMHILSDFGNFGLAKSVTNTRFEDSESIHYRYFLYEFTEVRLLACDL